MSIQARSRLKGSRRAGRRPGDSIRVTWDNSLHVGRDTEGNDGRNFPRLPEAPRFGSLALV